ncbi:MAG TPA: GGDEF domain-containing protein, partial [Victivallales bacterium]|nr:GGDEF domain-containing protein [Victivallales bacterium]
YKKIKEVLDKLAKFEKKSSYNRKDSLEIALQIEAHLLMPEFLMMFKFFSERDYGHNIEDYSSHINKLVSKIGETEELSNLKFLLKNVVNLFKTNLELAVKSFEDPLTGLLNRRAFYERAIPIAELTKRENKGLAIIIIDIDKFKEINDNFGHLEGDKIIVKLAKILKKSIRKYDLLCRFGGEEFLILAISDNIADAKNITERLRQKAEKELKINDKRTVTVSIGAKFTKKNISSLQSLNNLIKCSDKNLYEAKRTGRNKVVIS